MKQIIFGLLVVAILAVSCNSIPFAEIVASLPDMNTKPDGVYRGNYDLSGSPVKVTLDVTVQNHYISAVNIVKHVCSPIGKKAEKITETIIEEQSLNIDVVSGATGSSKAILKAVENALE
ncbi:MAG: FMN-binding protein [Treponema sp.]|jgi:uncharacterized protein with FMN-binding domain|nr:FMN-binding protein [Treponema sp.]